jgi:hypothetical protein
MPSHTSIHWLPVLPAWLIVLVALGLLAALAFGSQLLLRKDVPGRWVAILGAWRLVIVLVFIVALCQPVLSFTRSIEQRPELMVLVDTSRSMSRPAGSSTRLADVMHRLQANGLAQDLSKNYQVHWFHFDGNAYPVEHERLSGLQPVGGSTNVATSLTTATNLLRARGGSPERVLLVSDGNDLGQEDPVEAAQRLGLVVDTLAPAAGEVAPRQAVQITEVQCARRVLLGSETNFRICLRCNNARGTQQPVALTLTEDGKPIWSRDIAFRPGTSEQRLPVAHRPASTGIKRYEFRVGEGEPYQVSVQVVDAKHEMLVLEDTWRWEFKYLRRILEDDPSFRFTAMLSRGGNAFVQFGAPDRRVNLVGFPQSRAELEGFDTIVLGDVNARRWPKGLAAAIAEMVREEGRSLIVLAGPNLTTLAELRELNGLLPVDVGRESATPIAGPIDVRISEEGRASPYFRETVGEDGAFPDAKLPPLDQIYAPVRKRPGATVLLEAIRQANNAYGNPIVMAEHTVGRGRVVYLGTDTLWKWHTLGPENKAGVTPYTTFWQQTLRALTPAQPGPGGVQVWLQPSRSRIEAGRAVTLTAEIHSDRPLPKATIQATAILPDDRRLPLSFTMDASDPTVLRAEFVPSLAGPHRISAALVSAGRTEAENTTVIDVETAHGEASDAGVDHANLERIAKATGGAVIDAGDAQTWPKSTGGTRPVVQEAKTVDLWNNYTLMLLLCGLLGIDWMLRLVRGYV